MAEALRRTRCVLVVGKHIQTALPGRPGIEPFMEEHRRVLDAVRAGDRDGAGAALAEHLVLSKDKALRRLRDFQRSRPGPGPAYLIP